MHAFELDMRLRSLSLDSDVFRRDAPKAFDRAPVVYNRRISQSDLPWTEGKD